MGTPADGRKNVLYGRGVVGGKRHSTASALSPYGKDSVRPKSDRTYRLLPFPFPLPLEAHVLQHITYSRN